MHTGGRLGVQGGSTGASKDVDKSTKSTGSKKK